MTDSFALSVLLPASLGIIMLGLGLSLTMDDFKRVLVYPKAVFVALFSQFVILPIVCFGLTLLFGLDPVFAVGMMLLAASPGGTSANLFSHLANGDVALNITLTAVSSVLAIVMMPLIVNMSLGYFFESAASLTLQFSKVVQVFAIVLVPVAVGMVLHKVYPKLTDIMEKPVKIFSVVFLVGVVVMVVVTQWDNVRTHLPAIGAAVLAFNVLSLVVGYVVPRFVGIDKRQATAIGMEIGIHNSTLAITMAMSPALLNNPQMAMPAGTYGIAAYFTAAVFGVLVNRRRV